MLLDENLASMRTPWGVMGRLLATNKIKWRYEVYRVEEDMNPFQAALYTIRNMLYGVVKKGIPWPLGAFENRRTFTSIDNLCYIINGLLTKDIESGIYNINDDEAVSTNELIEIICSAMGKKVHIWRIPRGLMEGFAKIGGLLHLPLDPERLQKLTENYVSSNAKIKKALGIEKLPVRARDGLYKTIRSFEE